MSAWGKDNPFAFQFPPSVSQGPPLRSFFDTGQAATPGGFQINGPAPPMNTSFSFMMDTSSGRSAPSFQVRETRPNREPARWPWEWFCNGCNMKPTTGPRFHCTQCADFDFCSSCDKKNDSAIERGDESAHNPSHVFVKSRPPQ